MKYPMITLYMENSLYGPKPTAVKVGEQSLPFRELLIDWDSVSQIGELVLNISMHHVNIVFGSPEQDVPIIGTGQKGQAHEPTTEVSPDSL